MGPTHSRAPLYAAVAVGCAVHVTRRRRADGPSFMPGGATPDKVCIVLCDSNGFFMDYVDGADWGNFRLGSSVVDVMSEVLRAAGIEVVPCYVTSMDALLYSTSRHRVELLAVAPSWHRAGSEVTVLTWVGQNDALRVDARGARAMEEWAERKQLELDLAKLAGNAECYAETVRQLAGPGRALHAKFVDHPLGKRHGVYGVGKRAIERSFQATGLEFVQGHRAIMKDPAVWVDDLHLRQEARTRIGRLLAAVVLEGAEAATVVASPDRSQNRFFNRAAQSIVEAGMAAICADSNCTEHVTANDAKGFCRNCWGKWNASKSVDVGTIMK